MYIHNPSNSNSPFCATACPGIGIDKLYQEEFLMKYKQV